MSRSRKIKSIFLFFVLVLSMVGVSPFFVSVVSAGSTRYVSTTGNDATGDGTFSKPYRTIQKGVDLSVAGDTVCVRGGSYAEYVYMKASGTAGNPITITNYNDEVVVVEGTGVSIPSGHAQICLWSGSTSRSYITIRNLILSNSSQNSIRTLYTPAHAISNITISNCTFRNVAYRALYFSTQDIATKYVRDIHVSNCTFEEVTMHAYPAISTHEALTFYGCKRVTIRDCLFVDCPEIIIDFINNTVDSLIHNNIFFINISSQSEAAIYLPVANAGVGSASTCVRNITVSNNKIFTIGQAIMMTNEGTGYMENITIVNNIIYVYNGSNSINVHRDAGGGDFHFYNLTFKHNTIYSTNSIGSPVRLNIKDAYVHNFIFSNNIFSYKDNSVNRAVGSFNYPDSGCAELHFHNNLYHNFNGTTAIDFASGSDVITNLDPNAVNASPHFVSLGSNFYINSTSPAIDAGNTTYMMSTDYEGNSRPNGAGYDIGAYEYVFNDTIIVTGDSDFTYAKAGVNSGSGTVGDPYVIDGYTLDNVSISGTSLNFTISGCVVNYGMSISGLVGGTMVLDDIRMDGAGKGALCYVRVVHADVVLNGCLFENLLGSYFRDS